MIKLELEIAQVNGILSSLGQTHAQVRELIENIQQQATAQIQQQSPEQNEGE